MTSGGKNTVDDRLLGQVRRLADLVDYQEGSIVSRTVIDEKTGTVTLFAFDKGQGLSEHTAPFNALVHVLEGRASITMSGKPHEMAAGEAILLQAGQPHALVAVEKFKLMLVMVRA